MLTSVLSILQYQQANPDQLSSRSDTTSADANSDVSRFWDFREEQKLEKQPFIPFPIVNYDSNWTKQQAASVISLEAFEQLIENLEDRGKISLDSKRKMVDDFEEFRRLAIE